MQRSSQREEEAQSVTSWLSWNGGKEEEASAENQKLRRTGKERGRQAGGTAKRDLHALNGPRKGPPAKEEQRDSENLKEEVAKD